MNNQYSQNIIMSSSKFEEEKNYWLQKMNGKIVLSSFSEDFITRDNKEYCQGNVKKTLPENLALRILTIGGHSEYATYMILLAGVKYLLYRYTGYEDVIVGMPQFKETRHSGGITNNIIALRTLIKEGETFKEYLLKVKEVVLEAKKYKKIPFERLAELLDIENPRTEKGLGCVISLENIHEEFNLDEWKADTIFAFSISANNILLDLKFDTRLYKQESMERLSENLIYLLEAVSLKLDIKTEDLDIVCDKERKQVLLDFNNTKVEYDNSKLFHELFEEQSIKRPYAIAVVYNEKKLTYGEVNTRANQLARLLRSRGVKPDTIVGIMLERSVELIVCALAVIKAGGAYLPLDPAYPRERISYMAENSGMHMLLTQPEFMEEAFFAGEVINIFNEEIFMGTSSNLVSVNKPEDLMYIIYTSGTSGLPKGVMVEHGNVINISLAWKKHYRLEKMDVRLLQLASFSFDVFVGDMARTFINGGMMVICDSKKRFDLSALYSILGEHKISIFESTPSLIIPLMEYIYTNNFNIGNLKLLILGSDNVSKEDFEKLQERFGQSMRIINSYGVTEATIDSSFYENPGAGLSKMSNVPIGKPMQNTRFYILDQRLKLQPIGIYGELYIGGAGVTRGYVNNPELTEKSFIGNPFVSGERIYKTGDLARWTTDGNVEFYGRKDNQVKIRGYRVELGDIESRLLKCEEIKEAVVIAREISAGSNTLCAYYTSKYEIEKDRLSRFLSAALPEYMVPSCFIRMDMLPITPNGKIDRKALPKPFDKEDTIGRYIGPRNQREEIIQKVWQNVLGLEKISMEDNFFDLGGDSIKVINIVLKLAKYFDININDMFKYQTIGEMAESLPLQMDHLKTEIIKFKKEQLAVKSRINPLSDSDIKQQIDLYVQKNEIYEEFDLKDKKTFKEVLVTGSTGFFGCHLAYELLTSDICTLYLIVRGTTPENAVERLRKKFKYYFEEDIYEQYKDRIVVLHGDMTKANFGLKKEMYEELKNKIECVINSAANVKHYGQFEKFHDINVKCVEALIEFCSEGKRKDLNQVSTVGIAGGSIKDKEAVLFTEYDNNLGQQLGNHYLSTKFEAENILLDARAKGMNINIFRVSNLVFHSETGKFQENIADNAFYGLLKSFVKLKLIPETGSNGMDYDFSFIDKVSRAVALLYNRKNLCNETYHIYNPHKINREEISCFLKLLDYQTKTCSKSDFYDFLYENCENDDIQPFIENIILHYNVLENKDETDFVILNDKTNKILKELGFEWTKMNSNLMSKMIRHCESIGFI